MGDYATHADVEKVIPDIVVGGVFGAGTNPTADTVDEWIDGLDGQINSRLLTHGYIAPVVVGDDPQAFAWIKRALTAQACVLVLNTKPGVAFDPELPSPQVDRKAGLGREWTELLELIADEEFVTARSVNRAERLIVGSAKRSDGSIKEPIFTRGDFDYPGGPGDRGKTSQA